MTQQLAAAVSFAQRGWSVLPLKPGEKRPASRNGLHDATVDVGKVKRWWKHNPRYNIGLRCGCVVVVDVDRKNGGEESLDRLFTALGSDVFNGVPAVTTPGGRHFYFRQPSGELKRVIGLLPGIDLLGDGGYVVAPPSIREQGLYAWDEGVDYTCLRPDDLPTFPGNVLDYLIAARGRSTAPIDKTHAKMQATARRTKHLPTNAAMINEGERNSRLTSLAGSLAAHPDSYKGARGNHSCNQCKCVCYTTTRGRD
jgi:hypothetical protein